MEGHGPRQQELIYLSRRPQVALAATFFAVYHILGADLCLDREMRTIPGKRSSSCPDPQCEANIQFRTMEHSLTMTASANTRQMHIR